jgi:hypothetical protein
MLAVQTGVRGTPSWAGSPSQQVSRELTKGFEAEAAAEPFARVVLVAGFLLLEQVMHAGV